VLAVALVCGGIAALQVLVPPPRDSPAVLTSPPPVARGTTPPPTRTSPPATTRPPATAAATPSPTVATRAAVTVLNNSRITGLAKKAAGDFAARGWPIAGTGNLSGRLARTTVFYSEGQRPAAEALRKAFPAIADMAPRYAGLPGTSPLTVVVTREYPH
jgi:hypothetical protein